MDNGKADIIAGIRELRAKAAEQLTGNEYYMIVQQLDSLASSAELSDDAARSVFTLISARLAGGAPTVRAGTPEVPEIPDSPAQPDTPSTPDVPVVPDSPAQPDGSPGPDIPPPPGSPAEPETPPEVSAAAASAGSDEPVQIVAPSANSFGMPQATVAIRLTEAAAPSEPVTGIHEAAPAPVTGLAAAVQAARVLIEEKLSGNSYYSAANLLGQLQMLPPASGGGGIERPDAFDAALALLRREAAHLSGVARDEATRIISALENVLMPKPQTPAEKPVETAAPQKSEAAAPEPEPEPEPEPRTGFDDLAEAAWKRVQQVSAADARPAAALNGSAAPAAAMASQTAASAKVAEQAEMMTQDIGEAFDDGGSESRSSEPCYLHEFELGGAQHGASDRQQPAAEAAADASSKAERQAAVSAEAEALIAPAETGAEPLAIVVEKAEILTVDFEEVTEPQASGLHEAVPLEQPAAAETEPQVADLEKAAAVSEQAVPLDEFAAVTAETAVPEADPEGLELEPAVVASEPAAEETQPAAASSSVVVEQVEPATTAAPAGSEKADEVPGSEPQAPAGKPAKRGFFGRLFGGTSAENGR